MSATETAARIPFVLNGNEVSVVDGISLLDALRDELGCRSVKDGCSPQGQCGCCTIWVDGAPRVACVTPIRRVMGREVTTLEGVSPDQRNRWAEAFVAHGASQCGFCTPGIVMRLAALETGGAGRGPSKDVSHMERRRDIEAGLRAHLCRCTGWQSIVEAATDVLGGSSATRPADAGHEAVRDQLLAGWRAQLEGPAFQSSGTDVVLGGGGFADDTAPAHALLQLGADAPLTSGIRGARAGKGRQGRNSTVSLSHPVVPPEGDWALTLATTWVEPAYVEPDASWCFPGEPPASPLANGGAFGGKRHSPLPARARSLADEAGQPVRVLWCREDVVRRGPKRPPLGLALRTDCTGIVRIGCTPGSADLAVLTERVLALAPGIQVELVDIAGPPVSADLRGAGWAEVLAALHALEARPGGPGAPHNARSMLTVGTGRADVTVPGEGRAVVEVHPEDRDGGRSYVEVDVWAGELLCPVTLRSYALGAVHQALGMVWSEGIAVDETGEPVDLTIRSFGILAARDMPEVIVRLHEDDGWPVNGSDAVFVATLAAAWIAEGLPPEWPTRRAAVRTPVRDVAPSGGREEEP
ncbi:MAG TPA: 2Fe-2S iron-sulfur cluster-binding protein [Acidimicrobiales bacterium]|nr:2Fe-2S iron-sulfur cluster-binding protein [Acidimicrobiales bacterium]